MCDTSSQLDGYEQYKAESDNVNIFPDVKPKKPKELYMDLLMDSKEFNRTFPHFSGEWKKDKKQFKEYIKSNPFRRNEGGII